MLKTVRADKSIREIAKEKLEKAITSGKFMKTGLDMQIEVHLPKIRGIREDSNYVKVYKSR